MKRDSVNEFESMKQPNYWRLRKNEKTGFHDEILFLHIYYNRLTKFITFSCYSFRVKTKKG